MFDILEADIVVLQETKIQRKDLSDDIVLVPGWDCYFSFPRYKKGYSGVAIYTRQSTCAPIRAEEGITGQLCPPQSSVTFVNSQEQEQIGGYPSFAQLAQSPVDATTLDSEGRCIILEFPAFVLLGVYCPANRDETRDDFRHGFLQVLDARVRNLVALGKRVFLTGDLNISREEKDAANVEVSMRKQGLEGTDFVSTPARRLFNHMLEGGKVFGGRDEGRETSVLWDICRAFHSDRRGMFTCWDQKVNARPGNYGARIDYVLCSLDMKEWFCDSNIQEGLMGSDHCPVYAVMKDKVLLNGKEHHLRDLMNPSGMFLDGRRKREYSATVDLQQLSGRLLTEFSGRRNIRDMFSHTTSMSKAQGSVENTEIQLNFRSAIDAKSSMPQSLTTIGSSQASSEAELKPTLTHVISPTRKRSSLQMATNKATKRTKLTSSSVTSAVAKGQQSLTAFLRPKEIPTAKDHDASEESGILTSIDKPALTSTLANKICFGVGKPGEDQKRAWPTSSSDLLNGDATAQAESENLSSFQAPLASLPSWESKKTPSVDDPTSTRESWSKLFTKPLAPRCESHDEACISMLTRKPGINLGRSFWMCSRPLGPSGFKEKNSQWRCGTFIWCSDWNGRTAQNT